tara:strand:- start:1685 stop:2221 length:537 start_codon:yes stop_codon:yes gene_type:complete
LETIKKSYILILVFIVSACNKIEVDVKNNNFNSSSGVLYKNDKSYTGTLKTIKETGNIIFEQFRDGKKNGTVKTFYSNGRLRSLERYRKNRLNGLQNSWWPDGAKRSQALYNNGLLSGIYFEWYNNGQLEREMRYKKGLQYGKQKGWRENGELKFSYTFREGKRYGFVGSSLCMSPYQ